MLSGGNALSSPSPLGAQTDHAPHPRHSYGLVLWWLCSGLWQGQAAAASSCCSLAPLRQLLAVSEFVITASSATGVADSTSRFPVPPVQTYSSWPLVVWMWRLQSNPILSWLESVFLQFFSLCPKPRRFRVDVESLWFPVQPSHCVSVLSCIALLPKSGIVDSKIIWSSWCDWVLVDEYTETHPFLPCPCQVKIWPLNSTDEKQGAMRPHICCLQLLLNLPCRLGNEVVPAVTTKPLHSLDKIFPLLSMKKTRQSIKTNPVSHCPVGFFKLLGNFSVEFLFLLALGSVIQV